MRNITVGVLLGNKGAHIYNGNILQCSRCKNIYKTQSGLDHHKCAYCCLCEKQFSSYQRMTTHKCVSTLSQNSSTIKKKDVLTSNQTNKNDLVQTNSSHLDTKNTSVCTLCNKTFTSSTRLNSHKCTYCNKCKKNYSTIQRLKLHKCTADKLLEGKGDVVSKSPIREEGTPAKDSIKHFTPEITDKMDSSKSSYNLVQCIVCKRRFRTKTALQNHTCRSEQHLVHTDPPHINDICNVQNNSTSLAPLVGNYGTYIPDDIIERSLILMRDHSPHMASHIGQLTPAQMQFMLHEGGQHLVVSVNTLSINLHHINNHWVCSTYDPSTRHVNVYDSLTAPDRIKQLNKQLHILYGSQFSKVNYIPITQQGTDPACGAFAIAAAFCCLVGIPPETQAFDVPRMRHHLKLCIQQSRLTLFPTVYSAIGSYFRNEAAQQKISRNSHSAKQMPLKYKATENDKLIERRQHDRIRNKIRRQDPSFKTFETDLNKERRQNSSFKTFETDLNKKRREDSSYRKSEENYNKTRRQNPSFKTFETDLNKKRREDSSYRKSEENYNKTRRLNPCFKTFENDLNKERRQNSSFKTFETDLNKKRRSTDEFHDFEIQTKRKKRLDPNFKHIERQHDSVRKEKSSTIEEAIQKFRSLIQHGCSYVCTCCFQLWFRESVIPSETFKQKINNEELKNNCFSHKLSHDGKEWLCVTCASSLRKSKLPSLARRNNIGFPNKPQELELNHLEERLVAPINPFMQLRELPRGGQMSVRGNVVNVPADNLTAVTSLPRRLNECDTIPVKLKRRIRYKSHFMYENVRPEKCLEATKFLLSKELFKNYVTNGIDENWLIQHIPNMRNTNWSEILQHSNNELLTYPNEQEVPTHLNSKHTNQRKDSSRQDSNVQKNDCKHEQSTSDSDSDCISENDDTEESTKGPAGLLDTMMTNNFDATEGNTCFSVAPSEGNVPISGLTEDIEELAFPTIFCGQKRPTNKERKVPVKYSEICKFELRAEDRRVAESINNIFFKLKRLQAKQISDKVWLAMKRHTSKGKSITAAEMRDPVYVDNLVKIDEGYRIFRTLRGSPPYWEAAKKDIFAMLRQLGLPTWFVSLSAAETRWHELLHLLSILIDKTNYSAIDISNMNWETKSRLIRSDPVTAARFFHHRVQVFFKEFLRSPAAPIGHISDFFYRIEMQQRGSPHIHALLWIEGAPVYNSDPLDVVHAFIDKYITIAQPTAPEDLASYQVHRHTHTCRKKGTVCRFHFPLPPMRCTSILTPLTAEDIILPHQIKIHKQNWSKIQMFLKDNDKGLDVTFDDFLQLLDLTEEKYILAIRSSLKDDRVFLMRNPNCVRVNSYNRYILNAWQANIDIQFVTDAYACAMYIISYISKGQRGMSQLLRDACEQAKKGDFTIKEQVRTIGNKFTNHVEISAQEAAFLVLQLPLRRCSRASIFINTSPKEDRPFILKSAEVIEKLPDDSEDVACSNIISRYSERPNTLLYMCLADFAAWYDIVSKPVVQTRHQSSKQELPEDNDEDNNDDDPLSDDEYIDKGRIRLKKTHSLMRKRKYQKVIRYVRYSVLKDSENYYREALMLFLPWRNENELIRECTSYENSYLEVKEEVDCNRQRYEKSAEDLDRAQNHLDQLEQEDEDLWNDVAPCTNYINQKDTHDMPENLHPDENLHTFYDIGADMGIPGTDMIEETMKNRVSDAIFREMARSLNKKQKEMFYHILKIAKVSDQQHFIFLSGGAGVGKTLVVKATYQALLRFYNTSAGQNPECTTVLLAAPTGKAAYLIGGKTLHRAFHVPANQSLQYKNLNNAVLNTMRCCYRNLKFIFIDEISMCGSRMFQFINLRMQELMGVHKPFGGVHVVTIGDLFQLKPVMDQWIFNTPASGYSLLAPNIWTENFDLFELVEVMRQKDDLTFAELLNRMREGNHTDKDIKLLKTRQISANTPNYPMSSTHIIYRNDDVNQHNSHIQQTLKTEKATLCSIDVAVGDVPESVKREVERKAPQKSGDAMGLAKEIKSALELKHELTVNVDVDDGLVNGADCVTKHFHYLSNMTLPNIIWVHFTNGDVGRKLRQQSRHLYNANIQPSWTPIKQVEREFPVGRYKNVKILRKQFPLQLASAKTVYRAQGDTMQSAVLKLPNEKRAHVHYVAFSRVTTLDNIYIVGDFDSSKITLCKPVTNEMNRLRSKRPLHLLFSPLYTLSDNFFKICFHNSQSLNLHAADMIADLNYHASDVNMFFETRLCSSDSNAKIQLPGFNIHRNDFSLRRTTYGSVLFTKDNLTSSCHSLNHQDVEITLAHVHHPIHIYVVGIYCRPKEEIKTILSAIRNLKDNVDTHQNLVIIGDFNIQTDNMNAKYKQLQNCMSTLGCRQVLTDVTTNGQTAIDHIYTNVEDAFIQYGTLESYYSYHKPVWFALAKNKDILLPA